jgi:hypothetical protein
MCDPTGCVMHSPQCIHQHALLLSYLSCRAMIDGDINPRAQHLAQQIPGILSQPEFEGLNLDAVEKRFFKAPFGSLNRNERAEASWLIEGMAVLSWAIGKSDLPPFHQKVEGSKASAALGIFQPDSPERIAGATIRNPDEVESGAITYSALSWRLSEQNKSPKAINFAEKLKDPKSPHLLVDGIELKDGDLAIDGTSLREVPPKRFGEVSGIVFQRYKAFRWLLGLENGYATLTTIN